MGAQSGSGSIVTSTPGSSFEGSNYSGSNCSVKSQSGNSSFPSSNHYETQEEKEIYEEREKLLKSNINGIYIGIEPIGTKIGHAISTGVKSMGIKNFLPAYLGGSTFTHHASCFCFLSSMKSDEGIILEYGGYSGGDSSYKNYIHYAEEDGMRFSKMTLEDYKKKIHNGLKGSQIIEKTISNNITLENLINKCILNSKKNWRKDDYNLSSYNCQDFVAKVIEVLFVKRKLDEPSFLRHNYALSIYPPVIVKALEKNEIEYDNRVCFIYRMSSIPIIGAYSDIVTDLVINNKGFTK